MKMLVMEGWRFSPTSYAVVNQYQCLEMLRRPELGLYHVDVPFFTEWRHIQGLLDPSDEEKIKQIPAPPPDLVPDASIRMTHPTLIQRTNARQTWSWVVTEFGILENSRIADKRPAKEALQTEGIRYITPSRWSFDGLIRSGADPARVAIVPCGYDPSLIKPLDAEVRTAMRRQLGWEGRYVFLNVSTLVWNKGIAALLRGFASVMQQHPQAVLVLKGNSEMLQSDRRLREAVAAMPPQLANALMSRLQYIGDTLTHRQMAAIFASADAYVSPYHAEGFNMPVLEAAASGVPVICTAGGPTDDFTDPSFCQRINSREFANAELEKNHGPGARALVVDGDHLTHLMSSIIADPGIGERARVAGPAYLSQRFTWKHVVDQLLGTLFSEKAQG